VIHNSRVGCKKSPDIFCCVTTRKAPQACPWQQTHFQAASGPETPAAFAAGVPPPHAGGGPRLWTGTFVAVSPPANAGLPLDTRDLDSTIGYTASLEIPGRTLSVNSFATPAVPGWSRHPCLL